MKLFFSPTNSTVDTKESKSVLVKKMENAELRISVVLRSSD
jgi:hypothetical protein